MCPLRRNDEVHAYSIAHYGRANRGNVFATVPAWQPGSMNEFGTVVTVLDDQRRRTWKIGAFSLQPTVCRWTVFYKSGACFERGCTSIAARPCARASWQSSTPNFLRINSFGVPRRAMQEKKKNCFATPKPICSTVCRHTHGVRSSRFALPHILMGCLLRYIADGRCRSLAFQPTFVVDRQLDAAIRTCPSLSDDTKPAAMCTLSCAMALLTPNFISAKSSARFVDVNDYHHRLPKDP